MLVNIRIVFTRVIFRGDSCFFYVISVCLSKSLGESKSQCQKQDKIVKIGYGHLWLRGENIGFNDNCII
jgi:hypothetical protein